MEVVTPPPPPPPSFPTHSSKNNNRELASGSANCVNSMSQGFHQGIFSFSNGFDRSTSAHHQPQHIAQQSRRDKLRVQGFEPPPPPPLVGIEEEEPGELHGYETGGMLSEMFNFPPGAAAAAVAADLLDNQIASSYHLTRTSPAATATANEWYGHRQTNSNDRDSSSLASHHHPHHHHHQQQHHQISGINADSAAAMQLFLMNPQPRSPSPPPQPTSSTPLHLLLPNPSTTPPHVQGFQSPGAAAFGNSSIPTSQFTWISGSSNGGGDNPNKLGGGLVDNQGLSLSLSSSLQHLEAAKAEELRMGDGGMLYFNTGNAGSTAPSYGSMKNLRTHHHHHQEPLHLQAQNHNGQVHVGFGSSSLGVVNVLRNSKYAKPAHELLEEFCSVGRGQFKNKRLSTTSNANPNQGSTSGAGTATGSPSSSKDIHPLSAADRIEYQRRKVKLVSMIDEVDRRYNHYCEQMQMVVNSFDSVMGFGAATPYTVLAQKAMSRHFRCLKDAIAAQLKHTCELLGEKDGMGASGVTKGETPRLKKLEQSLRQQRAFHQMGMMEQEAWRPQRGLPERSVNILRAWLFEHFLHPYPSDADKHLLARQTGLSRNQVSNWFINARVRLWKPMVEDMYQQEAKEEAEDDREIKRERSQQGQSSSSAQRPQTPTPITAIVTAAVAASAVVPLPTPTAAAAGGAATTTSSSTTTSTNAAVKRSEINALMVDNDHSLDAINRQCFSENQVNQSSSTTTTITTNYHDDLSTMALPQPQRFSATHVLDDTCRQHGGILAAAATNYGTTTAGASLIRFGTNAATATATTTTGDVSLTLGLRHAGNLPEQNRYSVRDFGGC